jgi:hypothetical protein
MKRAIMLGAVATLLAGCGAIFNGGPASVMFTSSPNEAEVWINDNRMGVTPVSLQLAKNQNHTVVFRRQGFTETTYQLDRKVSAGYVILDVLGGLIPVVIDAATGAWYVLPTNAVNVTLAQAVDETAESTALAQRGTLTAGQLAQVRRGVPISRVITIDALLQ